MAGFSSSAIVPTLNEVESIGRVILDVEKQVDTVYVIDGGSQDGTKEVVLQTNAKLLRQKSRGKGNALREAFKSIKSDIYVIIDGDGTYNPSDIPKLISPIVSDSADMTIANRLSFKSNFHAFHPMNFIGNQLISRSASFLFRESFLDILSGFRAINASFINECQRKLSSDRFEIESELTALAWKRGFRVLDIPSTYLPRLKDSKSKLSPILDSLRITLKLFRLKTEVGYDQKHKILRNLYSRIFPTKNLH